jgi:hypothetical protein
MFAMEVAEVNKHMVQAACLCTGSSHSMSYLGIGCWAVLLMSAFVMPASQG